MLLGSYTLNRPVCSAPMAGVTDKAYRKLAREMGCDITWTEMISATALIYGNKKTKQILDISNEDLPVEVQLFGSDPEVMAKAAYIAVAEGAPVIDINMGCPAPKVVKNCEGSALLKNLSLAGQIVEAVVKTVDVPVTVKFRLGWDSQNLIGVELAKRVQESGAAALIVHGRTREQFYSGKADWQAIAVIKNAVDIPVIGNGDIWTPEDAQKMLTLTRSDGLMIGRGSLGNPWIFKRVKHYLDTGELLPEPLPAERISVAKRHFDLLLDIKGDRIGVLEMRKHAAWYIKGLMGATKVRELIMAARTPQDMRSILDNYQETLAGA